MRTSRSAGSRILEREKSCRPSAAERRGMKSGNDRARFSVKASAATAVASSARVVNPTKYLRGDISTGAYLSRRKRRAPWSAHTCARDGGAGAPRASKYPPIDRKQRNLRTRASLEILLRAPRELYNLCVRVGDLEDGKSGEPLRGCLRSPAPYETLNK